MQFFCTLQKCAMCNLLFLWEKANSFKKTSSREWKRSAPNISVSPEPTLKTGTEPNFTFAINNFYLLLFGLLTTKTIQQNVSYLKKKKIYLISFNPHWCSFLKTIFWLNTLQGQIKLNNNTSLDSSALRFLQLGQTKEQTGNLFCGCSREGVGPALWDYDWSWGRCTPRQQLLIG